MTTNRHWTEDDERLRAYLFRTVSTEDRTHMDRHLRSCESCRMRLQEEHAVMTGVRRHAFARDLASLRALTGGPASSVPWPRVLSIAAVIVLITGIGVYNRWFSVQEPGRIDQPQEADRTKEVNEEKNEVMSDRLGPAAENAGTRQELDTPAEPPAATIRKKSMPEPAEYRLPAVPLNPQPAPAMAEAAGRPAVASAERNESLQKTVAIDRADHSVRPIVVGLAGPEYHLAQSPDSIVVILRQRGDTIQVLLPEELLDPAPTTRCVNDSLFITSEGREWVLQLPAEFRGPEGRRDSP